LARHQTKQKLDPASQPRRAQRAFHSNTQDIIKLRESTMTEEKEPAASPSGTVLDTALDMEKGSIGPLLDFGKQELYMSVLQELAAKRTIVDGGEKKTRK
jgi:hypothetical protein